MDLNRGPEPAGQSCHLLELRAVADDPQYHRGAVALSDVRGPHREAQPLSAPHGSQVQHVQGAVRAASVGTRAACLHRGAGVAHRHHAAYPARAQDLGEGVRRRHHGRGLPLQAGDEGWQEVVRTVVDDVKPAGSVGPCQGRWAGGRLGPLPGRQEQVRPGVSQLHHDRAAQGPADGERSRKGGEPGNRAEDDVGTVTSPKACYPQAHGVGRRDHLIDSASAHSAAVGAEDCAVHHRPGDVSPDRTCHVGPSAWQETTARVVGGRSQHRQLMAPGDQRLGQPVPAALRSPDLRCPVVSEQKNAHASPRPSRGGEGIGGSDDGGHLQIEDQDCCHGDLGHPEPAAGQKAA